MKATENIKLLSYWTYYDKDGYW